MIRHALSNRFGVAALALAVAGWVVAPVMGKMRDVLLRTFPGSFLKVLAASLALIGAVVVVGALRRVLDGPIRSRLPWLVGAVGLLVLQLVVFAQDVGSVNVVEKIHLVQYSLLAVLLSRAFQSALDTGALETGALDTSALDGRAARTGGAPDSEAGERLHGDFEILVPALIGALVGLVDESVQGFFQLRTGDIRDVSMNGLSSVMGACIAAATGPGHRLVFWASEVGRRADGRRADGRRAVGLWASILIFGVGLFFHQAHLGYLHRDPAVGAFRSWFSPERLPELAGQRQAEWAQDPPTGLRAWDRQDYFLTEAAWHANHRNERLSAEDWPMAWRANQILERHYDPFLDIESFRGSGKHRWDAALRGRVEAQVAALLAAADTPPLWLPETYHSPVLSRRIHVWPRRIYLAGWLTVSLLPLIWAGWTTRPGKPPEPPAG